MSTARLDDEGTPVNQIEGLLRTRGPMSRAELARVAGLHRSTVTAAAGQLCALGPQAVILGGVLTGAGDLVIEEVTRLLRAACLPVNRDVAVLTGALGPSASVFGAATLALTVAI